MSEPTTLGIVEELERLGLAALAAADIDAALWHFEKVESLIPRLPEESRDQVGERLLERLWHPAFDAGAEVSREDEPPPKTPDQRAGDLRAEAEQALASGQVAVASARCFRLGEVLEELGDSDEAESAYRRAVVLARQVDADDPELMLAAFRSLIRFLAPSEESAALGSELAANLVEREEMYHSMRAVEAMGAWAIAEVRLAEIAPLRIDHAIQIARRTIEMADTVCLHSVGQRLRRRLTAMLRIPGRDAEADSWQAEADRYEDWKLKEMEIPGHVHLWNLQ